MRTWTIPQSVHVTNFLRAINRAMLVIMGLVSFHARSAVSVRLPQALGTPPFVSVCDFCAQIAHLLFILVSAFCSWRAAHRRDRDVCCSRCVLFVVRYLTLIASEERDASVFDIKPRHLDRESKRWCI